VGLVHDAVMCMQHANQHDDVNISLRDIVLLNSKSAGR
jgi:hypothetical protein